MKKNNVWLVFVIVAIASMIVLTGCGSGGSDNNTTKSNVSKVNATKVVPKVNTTKPVPLRANTTKVNTTPIVKPPVVNTTVNKTPVIVGNTSHVPGNLSTVRNLTNGTR